MRAVQIHLHDHTGKEIGCSGILPESFYPGVADWPDGEEVRVKVSHPRINNDFAHLTVRMRVFTPDPAADRQAINWPNIDQGKGDTQWPNNQG
jgi:hypothetical protein